MTLGSFLNPPSFYYECSCCLGKILKFLGNYKNECICHLFIIIGKLGSNIVFSSKGMAETLSVYPAAPVYAEYLRRYISMQTAAPVPHRYVTPRGCLSPWPVDGKNAAKERSRKDVFQKKGIENPRRPRAHEKRARNSWNRNELKAVSAESRVQMARAEGRAKSRKALWGAWPLPQRRVGRRRPPTVAWSVGGLSWGRDGRGKRHSGEGQGPARVVAVGTRSSGEMIRRPWR